MKYLSSAPWEQATGDSHASTEELWTPYHTSPKGSVSVERTPPNIYTSTYPRLPHNPCFQHLIPPRTSVPAVPPDTHSLNTPPPVCPFFSSVFSLEPQATPVPASHTVWFRPTLLLWRGRQTLSDLLTMECLPGWVTVTQLRLNPTGAVQGQVRSDMDDPCRTSEPREPGQRPTPGASDAARGQVPGTEWHGSMEGAPGPAGPVVWALHHVSWGPEGLGRGPRGPGPRTVALGNQ